MKDKYELSIQGGYKFLETLGICNILSSHFHNGWTSVSDQMQISSAKQWSGRFVSCLLDWQELVCSPFILPHSYFFNTCALAVATITALGTQGTE